MLFSVVDVLGSNAADQGITGVAVGQQGADGEQDLGDGQGRAPLVLQDVQADHSLGVDVAVVDASAELDFGRFEGVVCGEVDVEEEDSTFVDRSRRSKDGADPLKEVVSFGSSAAIWWGIEGYCSKLFLNTFG